ncbi:MAG: lipid-A-disaccharide synthase [Bacteroidia bacterium]
MKYYIIAGEASGDLHGSNLIKALKQVDVQTDVRCWGGDLMQQQGATLVRHYRELAFMGFVEVIANLRTIFSNIDFCKKDIEQFQPDALVLIDYPGFNLRIAEWAHQKNMKVIYYISPQVWAWKESRVHKIKKVVDKMFVILPFEKEFYKKFDYDVDFVGHPLIDAIENFKADVQDDFIKSNNLSDKKIIALLPGSRKQEVSTMLPLMISAAKSFTDFQFVIGGAPSIAPDFYKEFISGTDTKIVYNQSYLLLKHASAALVTSGTATLETALFSVPEVVCYKGNTISYHIARQLIKVKYISLVNLIMNREVVKELIQSELNETNIKNELSKIINDKEHISKLQKDYTELKQVLGGTGASLKTAKGIVEYLKETIS